MLTRNDEISATAPVYNIRLHDIMLVVARHTKIGVLDMKDQHRRRETVRARHIFFYACRKLTRRSFASVGRECGGRDHATVIHGIKKVECHRKKFEPEVSRVMAELEGSWKTQCG